MPISNVVLISAYKGIQPFSLKAGEDFVVFAGANGSGKTRLLDMIAKHIRGMQDSNLNIKLEPAADYELINYSHFDARLQSASGFPPYVIHKAKDKLKRCDATETALNAILYIQDLARGYSPEFEDGAKFKEFAKMLHDVFGLVLKKDEDGSITGDAKSPLLFDLDINQAGLSPGQQYMLRMAVALFCNETNNNQIVMLDEPETHLHPDKLIKMVFKLKEIFSEAQFWISTHSIALISALYAKANGKTSIFEMRNGVLSAFGSDSRRLIEGLLGPEENRRFLQEIVAMPDAFASIDFAINCLRNPPVVQGTENPTPDSQTLLLYEALKPEDVIVDFGAGKGRLLKELSKIESFKECTLTYYAFDAYDTDYEECKSVMLDCGIDETQYYGGKEKLANLVKDIQEWHGGASYIMAVNVLHEIPPKDWLEFFLEAESLLNEAGNLLIVEQEELTYGERPYDNGFLVITPAAFHELFPNLSNSNVKREKFKEYRYNLLFTVPKTSLRIELSRLKNCMEKIRTDSINMIGCIKNGSPEHTNADNLFLTGIKLSFWTHQYANASLALRAIEIP